MVYICPGGNCTGIAIFFFDKVSHLKHPSEHSPHLRRQILCSHILFSSQSQATPCKGVVSLNQCLAQNYANLLVDTRDGSILTKVSLNIAVRHLWRRIRTRATSLKLSADIVRESWVAPSCFLAIAACATNVQLLAPEIDVLGQLGQYRY